MSIHFTRVQLSCPRRELDLSSSHDHNNGAVTARLALAACDELLSIAGILGETHGPLGTEVNKLALLLYTGESLHA